MSESKTVYRAVKSGEPELLEIYNYDKNFEIDYKLIHCNQIVRQIRFLPRGGVESDEGGFLELGSENCSCISEALRRSIWKQM